MTAPALDLHDDVIVEALADLRQRRKARRLGDTHFFDALYKAYLTGIAGALGITMLSGLVGDERITGAALDEVSRRGPGVVGVAVALAVAAGLRSGGRGGPLALEAADVRHVLLAPVDRDVALRQPARRQLRFTAFLGSVGGAVVGLLAFRRFGDDAWQWIASGAFVGTSTAVAMTGAAMVASGRRLGRRAAGLLGVPLVVWSSADAAMGTATSPTSFLGQAALWPVDPRPFAALAVLPVAALGVAGLRAVGGISLEAAERRARLVSHLQFAATFQDLRTVLLLRRQLAAELPRSTPWIRLRPGRRGPAIWRRDWRGILRWPATRVVRLVVLGVITGLSMAAAWAGTTPLVAVAGAALFIASLDAIEGLAQDVDHPDRRDSFPMSDGYVHLRHLAAPTVVLAIVGLVAIATAAAVGGGRLAFDVGLPLLLPGAALAAGAAAVSTLRKPPNLERMMVDTTGLSTAAYHGLPPAIASLGPLGALAVRWQLERQPGADPTAFAWSAAANGVLIAMLVLGWVRQRRGLSDYLAGNGLQSVGK